MNKFLACSMALVAASFLLGGCTHRAAAPAPDGTRADESVRTASLSGGAAGVRVYLDPATGKPRDPTAAELAADASQSRGRHVTAQSTNAIEAEPELIVLPSGEVRLHVGERGMHAVRMCRLPNGHFGECSAQQAAELARRDAAAPATVSRATKPAPGAAP